MSSPSEKDSLPAWVEFPALASPALDEAMHDVAVHLGVPVAQISVVSRAGQTFPGAFGLSGQVQEDRTTPLENSICQHVVHADAPLVLPDLGAEPHLHNARWAVEVGMGSYAGVPVHDRAGTPIGALCVLDSVARHWTTAEVDWLTHRAVGVSLQLQAYSAQLAMAEASSAMARSRSALRVARDAAVASLVAASGVVARLDLVAELDDVLRGLSDVGAVREAVAAFATTCLHASRAEVSSVHSGVLRPVRPGGPVAGGVADVTRLAVLPLPVSATGAVAGLHLRWAPGSAVPAWSTLVALADVLAPVVEWVLLQDRHLGLLRCIADRGPARSARVEQDTPAEL